MKRKTWASQYHRFNVSIRIFVKASKTSISFKIGILPLMQAVKEIAI